MANDDRDGGPMSPYQPGAAGNLHSDWPANVRTAEETIAAQQAKFDAVRTRNESATPARQGQGNE